MKCKFCKKKVTISPKQRKIMRQFMEKHFYVTQVDMAELFDVSQARISEIVRSDAKKGGL